MLGLDNSNHRCLQNGVEIYSTEIFDEILRSLLDHGCDVAQDSAMMRRRHCAPLPFQDLFNSGFPTAQNPITTPCAWAQFDFICIPTLALLRSHKVNALETGWKSGLLQGAMSR